MLMLRKSSDRGLTQTSWLNSYHSFSFGAYQNPEQQNFGPLRVLNDDAVRPGTGFGSHSHWNAEIISYVTKGSMLHRDSTGSEHVLTAGEFQAMSAGSGITHSEVNASADDELRFIQIWLLPDEGNVPPQWAQRFYEPVNGLQLIAAPFNKPNVDKDILKIHQDAYLYRLRLNADQRFALTPTEGRQFYLHILDGVSKLGDQILNAADAAGFDQHDELHATTDVEALLFDLPK